MHKLVKQAFPKTGFPKKLSKVYNLLTNFLWEKPIINGNPKFFNFSRFFKMSILCSPSFANPKPGSIIIFHLGIYDFWHNFNAS